MTRILGQYSTFFRGILGNMLSKGLQNCPRTVDCVAVEVRGQFCRPEDCIFPRDPEEKGGIFTLYPGFASFPFLVLVTNCGILGVLFFNMPRFPNRGAYWKTVLPICHVFRTGGILKNSTPNMPRFPNRGAYWKTVLPICHVLWCILENMPSSSKEQN